MHSQLINAYKILILKLLLTIICTVGAMARATSMFLFENLNCPQFNMEQEITIYYIYMTKKEYLHVFTIVVEESSAFNQ